MEEAVTAWYVTHLGEADRGRIACGAKEVIRYGVKNWTWKPEDVTCERCRAIYRKKNEEPRKGREMSQDISENELIQELRGALVESEAQVRELRELLTKSAEILEWGQRGVAFNSAESRELFSQIKAALRSVPPSGPTVCPKCGYEPDDSGCCCVGPKMHRPIELSQAPFDKTDAGEERKDLAQSSDVRGDAAEWEQNNAVTQQAHADGLAAPLLSNERASEQDLAQVPAASDESDGSSSLRNQPEALTGFNSRTGPQDVQLWFCEACNMLGKAFIKSGAGVYEGVYALEDSHKTLSPECDKGIGKMRVHNPDVISREEFVKQMGN